MNREVTCEHCGRHLFTARGTTIIEQMPCPNSKCRAKLNIKIVDSISSIQDIKYKFATIGQPPKQKESS